MNYQLTHNPFVLRLPDRAFIPTDSSNADYREYLAWLDQGNTPLPAPDPIIGDITDLAEAKKVACEYVRSQAHSRLQPTDWAVVREMEGGTPVPQPIRENRAATRAATAEKVSVINGKQKLSTLTEYLSSDEFSEWPSIPAS